MVNEVEHDGCRGFDMKEMERHGAKCDVFKKIESGSKEHLPIWRREGRRDFSLVLHHPSCVALVKNALPFSVRPTTEPEKMACTWFGEVCSCCS